MRPLSVFNSISLDGYFVDARGDMSWAHRPADPEWSKFSAENASGGNGTLLFGRKTYELMASFWPSDQAKKQMPDVAEGMNRLPKVVFSRSLKVATWANTTLVHDDLPAGVKRLKAEAGGPIVILGSGTIVAQLTRERLIDSYTFVIVPVVLGAGRTLFEGLDTARPLARTSIRSFSNGNLVATYEPK